MASAAGKCLRMSSLFTIPHVGEVQFRGNPLRCSAASTLMHLPGLSPSRTNFWYFSECMFPRSWNPSFLNAYNSACNPDWLKSTFTKSEAFTWTPRTDTSDLEAVTEAVKQPWERFCSCHHWKDANTRPEPRTNRTPAAKCPGSDKSLCSVCLEARLATHHLAKQNGQLMSKQNGR